jgi:hypothetical protein
MMSRVATIGGASAPGGSGIGEAADIVWTNRATTTAAGPNDTDGFGALFGTSAPAARAVIDAVIVSYERMIGSFNYPVAGTRFNLVAGADHAATNWTAAGAPQTFVNGKPTTGMLLIGRGNESPNPNDDNGWFLDPTPNDNSEFLGSIVNAFTGNAQNGSPAFGMHDFYTAAAMELVHCMGQYGATSDGFNNLTTNTGINDLVTGAGKYWVFRGPSISHLMTSGITGADLGSAFHTAPAGPTNQPLVFQGVNYYGADDVGGWSCPVGQRRLVNQVSALILKDAYGYSTVNPATFGSMYAVRDQSNNAITVRGGDVATSSQPTNRADLINVSRSGNTITMSVDPRMDVPATGALPGPGNLPAWVTTYDVSQVSSINIDSGAGNDIITVGVTVGVPITVNGGADLDTVRVNGTTGADTITVRPDGFTSGATTMTGSNFESLVLETNFGSDDVTVTGTASGRPCSINTYDAGVTVRIVNADAQHFPSEVGCYGGGGEDNAGTLIFDDSALAGNSTYDISYYRIQKNNGFAGVRYGSFTDVKILAETGSNMINVNSTAPYIRMHLNGGATADTYNVLETAAGGYAILDSGAGGDSLFVNGDNTGSAETRIQGSIDLTNLSITGNGLVTMATSPSSNWVLAVNGGLCQFAGVGAKLDLGNNNFIYDYTGSTVLPNILGILNRGRAGGTWNGDLGFTSSAARVNPQHNTTLGIMETTEYKALRGAGAAFSGHAIDDTAVLLKYTYYGDADFNGVVNFDDYVRTDVGFNAQRSGWSNGDYNGDGLVNFDDYVLIDIAFNTQSGTLGGN